MTGTVVALAQATGLMMSATFIIYVLIIAVPFTRRRAQPSGDARTLGWHLFVPALNEEKSSATPSTTCAGRCPKRTSGSSTTPARTKRPPSSPAGPGATRWCTSCPGASPTPAPARVTP